MELVDAGLIELIDLIELEDGLLGAELDAGVDEQKPNPDWQPVAQ